MRDYVDRLTGAAVKWHKLNARGEIVATTEAPDKATALATLGGGIIVSAVSYAMDSRYRGILARTDNGNLAPDAIEYISPQMKAAERYLTTAEVSQRLGIKPQRVRAFATRLDLLPRITKARRSRGQFVWTEAQVAQMRQYYDEIPPRQMHPIADAKRRAGLLRARAVRWGWLDPKPTTTPEP